MSLSRMAQQGLFSGAGQAQEPLLGGYEYIKDPRAAVMAQAQQQPQEAGLNGAALALLMDRGGGGGPVGGAGSGSLLELIHGGNKFNPHSADSSHGGHLHYAGNKVGRTGRKLQKMGFDVGENPKFGGVTPGVHSAKGWHPKGKAIDVNWNNPSQGRASKFDNEGDALDWLERWLMRKYG